MLNGYKTCHGGNYLALPTLHLPTPVIAKGMPLLPSMCSIDFIRPGFVLTRTTATMKHQGKRNGLYEVEITKPRWQNTRLYFTVDLIG